VPVDRTSKQRSSAAHLPRHVGFTLGPTGFRHLWPVPRGMQRCRHKLVRTGQGRPVAVSGVSAASPKLAHLHPLALNALGHGTARSDSSSVTQQRMDSPSGTAVDGTGSCRRPVRRQVLMSITNRERTSPGGDTDTACHRTDSRRLASPVRLMNFEEATGNETGASLSTAPSSPRSHLPRSSPVPFDPLAGRERVDGGGHSPSSRLRHRREPRRRHSRLDLPAQPRAWPVVRGGEVMRAQGP